MITRTSNTLRPQWQQPNFFFGAALVASGTSFLAGPALVLVGAGAGMYVGGGTA